MKVKTCQSKDRHSEQKELADLVGRSFSRHNVAWLFGSVARNEVSNHDIDVVIEVSEAAYRSWCKLFQRTANMSSVRRNILRAFWVSRNCKVRLVDISFLRYKLKKSGLGIDFHIHPPGWQERSEEIVTDLSHQSPSFIHSISCDAMMFSKTRDSFW